MCCIIMTMQVFPRKRDIFRDWIISNSSVMYNTCIGLTLYSFITIWLTKSIDTTVNVIVLAWRRFRQCWLFLDGMLSQRSFETAWHSFDVTVITGDCAQIARFMGQHGAHLDPVGPQMGPMLAPWTLLSGWCYLRYIRFSPLKSYDDFLTTEYFHDVYVWFHYMNI